MLQPLFTFGMQQELIVAQLLELVGLIKISDMHQSDKELCLLVKVMGISLLKIRIEYL